MGRRKVQWIKRARQSSGNLEKILPSGAKGDGTWLAASDTNTHKGRTSTCSLPIGNRKEALVRKWTA